MSSLDMIVGKFMLDAEKFRKIGEPIVEPGMPITYSKNGEEFNGIVEYVFLVWGAAWKIITQDKKITHPANIIKHETTGVRTDVNVGDECQLSVEKNGVTEIVNAVVIGHSSLEQDSSSYLKGVDNGNLYSVSTAHLAMGKPLQKIRQ